MNQSNQKPNQHIGFFAPLSREEWERTLNDAIKDGLSRPGDTYEDYLGDIARLCYGLDRDGNNIFAPSSRPGSFPKEMSDDIRKNLAEAEAANQAKK